MPEKRFSPEQMIAMMRQIEVRSARCSCLAPACEEAAILERNSGTGA